MYTQTQMHAYIYRLTFKNPAIDKPVHSDFRYWFWSAFSNLPHWLTAVFWSRDVCFDGDVLQNQLLGLTCTI